MHRRASWIVRLTLYGLAVMVCAPAAQRDAATIYVTVTDKGGKPIKGLTAADFTIKEDETVKTVLAAAPASEALSVALLVDRFAPQPAFSMLTIRAALTALVKPLFAAHPDTEVSVMTIDPAAVPQLPFTQSAVTINNFLNKVGPGVDQAVLADGIVEAARSMAHAQFPRRVIIGVVSGMKTDGSSVDGPRLADALRRSAASLWILEGRPSFGGGGSAPMREAAMTIAAPVSGGMALSVSVGNALETQAKRIGETIAAQYAVSYAAPSAATRLSVTVTTKDAKVLAPGWTVR